MNLMLVIRVLLALLISATLSVAAELHTLSGKTVSGELVRISAKEIVLRTSSGEVATPVAEILQIDVQRPSPLPSSLKYADVELTDGTVLHCTGYTLKDKNVELKLAGSQQSVTTPLAAIANLLNDAQDPATRHEWHEHHLSKKSNQDILAIKRSGVINDLEGTIAEAADAKGRIIFEYGPTDNRRKREIDPTAVQGIIFLRSLPADAPSPVCKVHDVNQNSLVASKLELTPKVLQVTTVAGPMVELPRDALARLDYSNDKVVFLTDLKPAEVVQKSKQGRPDPLGLDRNLENGPIQIEGQVYSKGLALHAYTELIYALDGKYAKFETVLGMDDGVGGDGRPEVRIEADGKELFAGTVTRKDKHRPLTCDIKGARQLRIVVASGSLFDFGDHVDLANPKLSK
jgi:hypothetical protein